MANKTKYVYDADGVEFTIYKVEKPTKSGPTTYWLLEDYSTGERRTLNNVSKEDAERRADQIRAAMVKGQAHRMLLSNGQWQDVCIAVEILRSAQVCESLGSVVRSWVECTAVLGDRATLLDAAKYYVASHHGNRPQPQPTRFDEAAKRYHAFKVADGKSASYCSNILSRIRRLTEKLPPGVLLDEITAGQFEHAIVSLDLHPKTRNEYKIMLGNLYAWAAKQNPPLVAKGFNPGKGMERWKVKHGEVEFLRIAELKTILATLPAKRPDLVGNRKRMGGAGSRKADRQDCFPSGRRIRVRGAENTQGSTLTARCGDIWGRGPHPRSQFLCCDHALAHEVGDGLAGDVLPSGDVDPGHWPQPSSCLTGVSGHGHLKSRFNNSAM